MANVINLDMMKEIKISASDHERIKKLMLKYAGINLVGDKRQLITARLQKYWHTGNFNSLKEYLDYVEFGENENQMQEFVNALTTNETRFFREPIHFDFLRDHISDIQVSNKSVRVWSAACSTGEEAYSTAMVLSDVLGFSNWNIVASDINEDVLGSAKSALYQISETAMIPKGLLNQFCLKGVDFNEGQFTLVDDIKMRTQFLKVNLNESMNSLGVFDVIFLRNVLIYFSADKQIEVVTKISNHLRRGGYLFVGHSETLRNVNDLTFVEPTIYQKVG